MTLTRRLTRALKRIRALEEENAELRRQLSAMQPFVPSYPFPNMTAPQPITNGTVWHCTRCGQWYPANTFLHSCTPTNAGNYQPLYTQFNPAANAAAGVSTSFFYWPGGEPVR